jgi:hypothetical protein
VLPKTNKPKEKPTPMSRKSITDKADRLKKNYRVILLGPGQALVIGDHDTYDVTRLSFRWSCNCLWGRHKGHWSECSHVVAVRKALLDPESQAPVARLAGLLQEVKRLKESA